MTCNNYTDETLTKIQEMCKNDSLGLYENSGFPVKPADRFYSYIVYGQEVGDCGTPHLQVYMEFNKKISPKQFAKVMGQHFHMEERRGTAEEASGYCRKGESKPKKDDTYAAFHPEGEEGKNYKGMRWGKLKEQGKRNDLKRKCDEISNGAVTAEEIALQDPQQYHQYGRTFHKIEDIAMRKKFRTEMTQGIWYHGPTGVGKSHAAFEGYHPDTHYVWKNDNNWQDGYTGQETVIINDFRGHIPYNELLQMVDKWPYWVPRRGREPAPFLAKTVIITSSLPPEAVYHRRAEEDSMEQLMRRFQVHVLGSAQKCPGGNNEPLGEMDFSKL